MHAVLPTHHRRIAHRSSFALQLYMITNMHHSHLSHFQTINRLTIRYNFTCCNPLIYSVCLVVCFVAFCRYLVTSLVSCEYPLIQQARWVSLEVLPIRPWFNLLAASFVAGNMMKPSAATSISLAVWNHLHLSVELSIFRWMELLVVPPTMVDDNIVEGGKIPFEIAFTGGKPNPAWTQLASETQSGQSAQRDILYNLRRGSFDTKFKKGDWCFQAPTGSEARIRYLRIRSRKHVPTSDDVFSSPVK